MSPKSPISTHTSPAASTFNLPAVSVDSNAVSSNHAWTKCSVSSAALLHNPEFLILDEPFSGLDVNTALVLRALLKALAREGKMILYSSHVLEVVEKICSSVVILRKGKVVAHDRVANLRALMQQPNLEGILEAVRC